MPTPSFTIILPTVYGPMLVNRHDINQMQALLTTGCATDHNGIVMSEQLLAQMETGGILAHSIDRMASRASGSRKCFRLFGHTQGIDQRC